MRAVRGADDATGRLAPNAKLSDVQRQKHSASPRNQETFAYDRPTVSTSGRVRTALTR